MTIKTKDAERFKKFMLAELGYPAKGIRGKELAEYINNVVIPRIEAEAGKRPPLEARVYKAADDKGRLVTGVWIKDGTDDPPTALPDVYSRTTEEINALVVKLAEHFLGPRRVVDWYYVVVDGTEVDSSGTRACAWKAAEEALVERLGCKIDQAISMSFVGEDSSKHWTYQVVPDGDLPTIEEGPIEVKLTLKSGHVEQGCSFSVKIEIEEREKISWGP